MPEFRSVTKKGQVTIPASIRKKWGLKPKQQVAFFDKGEKKAEIRPAADFYKLRGSVKAKKKYSDRKADQAVAEHIGREYEKKKND